MVTLTFSRIKELVMKMGMTTEKNIFFIYIMAIVSIKNILV